MAKRITADDQRKIKSELEDVRRIMRTIFLRLKSLDRGDIRVTRTEAALAAIERVLWTVTSEPGGVGRSAPIHAILSLPVPLSPAPELDGLLEFAAEIGHDPLLNPGSVLAPRSRSLTASASKS
jgi:hypothetical protein